MIYQHRRNASAGVAPSSLLAGEIAANTSDCVLYVGTGASVVSVKPRLSATDRLLGRSSAGAGPAEEITCTAAGRAILDDADSAAQLATLGAAPAASPTFTGVVAIPSGSAAAPSLVISGDTDTGIAQEGGANSLSIATAGSERVRVDSAGRVGIGTFTLATSPAGQMSLNVNGPVLVKGRISTSQTSAGVLEINGNITQLRSYGATSGTGILDLRTGGGGGSADSVAVRLDASQNVLVGNTTSPTSATKSVAIFNGTAPTGSVTDGIVLYAEDVSASSVLKVRDEAGNINILSGAAVFSQVVTVPAGTAGAPAIFSTTGTSDTGLFFPAADTVAVSTAATERCRITSAGNVLVGGTASPTSGVANLVLFNGTAPTASVTDGVVLFAADVSASSELRVRDEAGNVTTLSPHRFDLIPGGPSEPMAWAYYSERAGHRINVDMLRLARLVERLTGEKLVYEEAPL